MVIKIIIFRDTTPCSPMKDNRRFGGTYRLSLQGRLIFNEPHCVISRKVLFFIWYDSLGKGSSLERPPPTQGKSKTKKHERL
jgi:hypothetical protein